MSQFFQCPLSLYANKTPKKIALEVGANSYSYLQCNQLVTLFSKNFQSLGVKKGDKIALIPGPWQTPLLLFSLFRIGVVACPLDANTPKANIAKILDKMGCSAIFASSSFFQNLPPIKQEQIDYATFFKPSKNMASTEVNFLEKNSHATFLATSGTTSIPKIAVHSIANHYYSALGILSSLDFTNNSRYLLSLPLYHVAGIGIIWRTFLKGATLVTQENQLSLAATLATSKISHVSMVQTQLIEFLNDSSSLVEAKKHLKAILLGGSMLTTKYCKKAWQLDLPLYPSYGCTEMSSTVTLYKERATSPICAGLTLTYRQVHIDETCRIFVKGKTLFQGYLNEHGELHLPLDKEGFFHTKDRGKIDGKYGLQIFGREDRMFISGGENIYPEEIELALKLHPYIKTATVLPVFDAKYGSVPSAEITTERPISPEEITTFLTKHLYKYKIPKEFILT